MWVQKAPEIMEPLSPPFGEEGQGIFLRNGDLKAMIFGNF
jgi:hypothetical protein